MSGGGLACQWVVVDQRLRMILSYASVFTTGIHLGKQSIRKMLERGPRWS